MERRPPLQGLEPVFQQRKPRPPGPLGHAEIQVAEQAPQGQVRDVERIGELGAVVTEPFQAGIDPIPLVVDPELPAALLGAQRRLVAHRKRGLAHSVGQRVMGQHPPAVRSVLPRKEAAATGQSIQVLTNNGRVIDRRAVIAQQRRNLPQRIVRVGVCTVGFSGGRVDDFQLDTIRQTQLDRRSAHPARERRSRRIE